MNYKRISLCLFIIALIAGLISMWIERYSIKGKLICLSILLSILGGLFAMLDLLVRYGN